MQPTAAHLAATIGQTVNVRLEHWTVPMLITDAKMSYGNARLLVQPVNGTGSAWISVDRVKLTAAGANGQPAIKEG